MNQEKLWSEFSALSPQAQTVVIEFIHFLQRYTHQISLRETFDIPQPKLTDEPFVGMWRDRDDLSDSTAWVRQVRQREWSIKG